MKIRGAGQLDDFHHVLPWQDLLHAGQENLFSGLTALTAEFTVGEGELMTHGEPCFMAPDDKHDLISGTCSHLPKYIKHAYLIAYLIYQYSDPH